MIGVLITKPWSVLVGCDGNYTVFDALDAADVVITYTLVKVNKSQ
jgi:hypothetical protein